VWKDSVRGRFENEEVVAILSAVESFIEDLHGSKPADSFSKKRLLGHANAFETSRSSEAPERSREFMVERSHVNDLHLSVRAFLLRT
jgi:hypothetical protein